MAFDFPINLDLAGKRVLVVGAGTIAARKIDKLIKTGARVKVVSPRFKPGLPAKVKKAGGTVVKRPFRAFDLSGVMLVFAATDDTDLNAKICAMASKKNLWASSASKAIDGDFASMAVAKAGPISITVSTGGASPAMAKALRIQIQSALRKSDLPQLAHQLGQMERRKR